MNNKNLNYDEQDRLIEQMWEELEDIPFDEDENSGKMYIAQDWKDFEKGEFREDIWHWFDERHSKGVAYLLYGYVFSYDR